MISWLTKKISRAHSDAIIAPYANDALTLEVGAYGQPSYGRFFPNRIGIDIRFGKGVHQVASVYDLPFPDSHFQNVLCMSVLEHLEDPKKAIAEMHRVLMPGGRIIISVPFLFPIHDAPGDYWRFTKFGLQKLFHEGWDIEELKAETNPQESFAVLLQRLAYQARFVGGKFTKVMVFLIAKLLGAMPNMIRALYGDIHKKYPESEAFTSAFFLVAKKSE